MGNPTYERTDYELTDYELICRTIDKNLGQFVHEDDVAEVAIYCDAIEKAAVALRAVAASPPAGGPHEVGESVLDVANEMLQSFAHPGHPGEACLQSGWIPVRRVAEWRAVLKAAAAPRGQREQARRYRALPDCPACQGAGGFGPGTGFDQNGEWNGEPCEDCGGTGKTGFPWRSGEAICPVCGHAWSRHDPEDGCCDAPSTLDPGPCFCGRSLAVWRSKNIALRAAAPAPVGEPCSWPKGWQCPECYLIAPNTCGKPQCAAPVGEPETALTDWCDRCQKSYAVNDCPRCAPPGETPGAAEGRTETDLVLRKLLWLCHGHTHLYGDDGEMQCNECPLDFKRASAEEIDRVFYATGLRRYAASVGAAPAASGAREPEDNPHE